MIYVTGDTHGETERFHTKAFRKLKKQDTLIILGDFGFVWNANKEEKRTLKWLTKRRCTILFLDGSHENFDLLEKYPLVDFAGGRARKLGERLFWLQRGEIYEIEKKTIFAFGGAESLDKEARKEGETWFPQEVPTQEQYQYAKENLARHHNQVDYIVTHDAPIRLIDFLHLSKDTVLYETTQLEIFFSELFEQIHYKKWVFGRYHKDQKIGNLAAALFQNILLLSEKD